jgi:hypothetical protein
MVLLLFCFAAAPPVFGPLPAPSASKGAIVDPLRLFSPETIEAAEQRILALQEEFGYELRIETTESQPPARDLTTMWYWHKRQEQLRSWVHDQARASGMKQGLYIIISQKPLDVRVEAWPADTRDKFLMSRREEIRRGMLQSLRLAAPNRALNQGVERWAYLLETTREIPSPLKTIPLLIFMGILTAVWLGLCLIRRRLDGATSLYPPAVQGGIFGTPVASWIYDRLFADEKEKPQA